jgi:hypothetical protein
MDHTGLAKLSVSVNEYITPTQMGKNEKKKTLERKTPSRRLWGMSARARSDSGLASAEIAYSPWLRLHVPAVPSGAPRAEQLGRNLSGRLSQGTLQPCADLHPRRDERLVGLERPRPQAASRCCRTPCTCPWCSLCNGSAVRKGHHCGSTPTHHTTTRARSRPRMWPSCDTLFGRSSHSLQWLPSRRYRQPRQGSERQQCLTLSWSRATTRRKRQCRGLPASRQGGPSGGSREASRQFAPR